jgi:hypothetical protein
LSPLQNPIQTTPILLLEHALKARQVSSKLEWIQEIDPTDGDALTLEHLHRGGIFGIQLGIGSFETGLEPARFKPDLKRD